MQFFSQHQQDEFLERMIFKGFQGGFFVDVGAHDGLTFNNTLFFERYRGWTGINIEPIPSVFERLQRNRPETKNINCAVCKHNGTAEFIVNTGYTEMLSGLKGTYDTRHQERLNTELSHFGGSSETIMVPTQTLQRICERNDTTHVHYLSIDTEGAEEDVVRSIDFDQVMIDVIGFENNYDDTSQPVIEYLERKGYFQIDFVGSKRMGDVFMIHQNSQFIQ